MKPVDKKPPSGKNAPKHPVSGETGLARRGFGPAETKEKKEKKK